MADGTQQPLLPVVEESTSPAGDPVRSSLGERFLSWFPRFRREKKPPPPPRSVTAAAPAPSEVNPASLAAAAAGFAEAAARGTAFGDESKSFAEAARAFAEAARAFAEANEEEEEPRDPRFAEDLMGRASALAVAADVILQQKGMSMSTTTTGLAVKALSLSMDSQALLPGFALLPPSSGPEETELLSLLRRARQFRNDTPGTSMEESAKDFYQAAEAFASGDRNYEKVTDIPLTRAAMNLSAVASRAPPEEKKLVLIAQKLESDASVLVLDENDTTLVQPNVRKVRTRTCMQWLSGCISGPTLPLHRHDIMRQEKLAEKRQVIFVIVLSTSIALLTTMIAGSVLPDEHTPWVGGVSASIWILVNVGFVMNLYGKTSFELCAAQHLSRLGMLGLAILVCIYMYMWFFPTLKVLFWTLVSVAALFHCTSWLVGCCRHDDDSTYTSPADEECMCSRCRPCSCACRQGGGDLESSAEDQVHF